MLNDIDKYINFLITFIVVLIFCILIIVDMKYFNKRYYCADNIKDYVQTQKLYSKSNLYPKYVDTKNILKTIKYTVNENKEEEENIVVKENIKIDTNKSSKSESINKIENVNVYVTNKWRIKIPKLKVNAPISEGTTQEALRRTVGHFTQTNKWNGNVALAAHNRGYKCNFFQEIKKLQKGDIIIYSTERGERKYQVVINEVIKETNWKYIQNTEDNRITLITCETDKKAYRRCIQAVEIL